MAAIWAQIKKRFRAVLAIGNSVRDGSGTQVTIVAGGGTAGGSRVDTIAFAAISTTTEGRIVLCAFDNVNKTYIGEIYVPKVPDVTTPNQPWRTVFAVPAEHQNLPTANDSIIACPLNSETFHAECVRVDFA